MTALTINQLFYMVTHYPGNEKLGDRVTTLNSALESQYIAIGIEIYNAITDEGLTATGNADAKTFGDTSELENHVTAYICGYLAEVDLHPKEFEAGNSAVWESRFMQMALQILHNKYPNKIEAKAMGGGGLVWLLKGDKEHNISVMFGIMRNKYSLFVTDEGASAPTSSDETYGR